MQLNFFQTNLTPTNSKVLKSSANEIRQFILSQIQDKLQRILYISINSKDYSIIKEIQPNIQKVDIFNFCLSQKFSSVKILKEEFNISQFDSILILLKNSKPLRRFYAFEINEKDQATIQQLYLFLSSVQLNQFGIDQIVVNFNSDMQEQNQHIYQTVNNLEYKGFDYINKLSAFNNIQQKKNDLQTLQQNLEVIYRRHLTIFLYNNMLIEQRNVDELFSQTAKQDSQNLMLTNKQMEELFDTPTLPSLGNVKKYQDIASIPKLSNIKENIVITPLYIPQPQIKLQPQLSTPPSSSKIPYKVFVQSFRQFNYSIQYLLKYMEPIYDLSEVEISVNVYKLTNTNFLTQLGLGIHHSAMSFGSLFELAYGFAEAPGTGVYACKSGGFDANKLIEKVKFGKLKFDSKKLISKVVLLAQQYKAKDYDLLRFNCNDFTNSLLKELFGLSLPEWVNRAAKIGQKMYKGKMKVKVNSK